MPPDGARLSRGELFAYLGTPERELDRKAVANQKSVVVILNERDEFVHLHTVGKPVSAITTVRQTEDTPYRHLSLMQSEGADMLIIIESDGTVVEILFFQDLMDANRVPLSVPAMGGNEWTYVKE